jgi:hypothetical protein
VIENDNLNIEFDELDFNFEFDVNNFDLDNIINISENELRYIKPPLTNIKSKYIKYQYAEDLAKVTKLQQNERLYVIVDGTFIFGDYLEALAVTKNIYFDELTISTLSLSQNNIDSLANLINGDYLGKLNLIVSDYYFSHERQKLIPYMYEVLDIDNKFQLAVCNTHCKIAMIKTGNHYITIHGSANLRSSGNIEQIMIENNKELYDFNYEIHNNILNTYKTINKSIRNKKLWQVVHQAEAVVGKEENHQQEVEIQKEQQKEQEQVQQEQEITKM